MSRPPAHHHASLQRQERRVQPARDGLAPQHGLAPRNRRQRRRRRRRLRLSAADLGQRGQLTGAAADQRLGRAADDRSLDRLDQ